MLCSIQGKSYFLQRPSYTIMSQQKKSSLLYLTSYFLFLNLSLCLYYHLYGGDISQFSTSVGRVFWHCNPLFSFRRQVAIWSNIIIQFFHWHCNQTVVCETCSISRQQKQVSEIHKNHLKYAIYNKMLDNNSAAVVV